MKRLTTSLKGIVSFLPLQGGLNKMVATSNSARRVVGNRFNSPVFHI